MALTDDDLAGFGRPQGAIPHVIGQDLAALSVEELRERAALLRAEADRLDADAKRKTETRGAADAFFKL